MAQRRPLAMNATLIKSAIRLTAITAAMSKNRDNAEHLLRSFLANTIPASDIDQFVGMFIFHLKNFSGKTIDNNPKRIASLSVKGVLLCDELNEEFSIRDKVLLLLLQLQIILVRQAEVYELDYLRALSGSLYLCDDEFEQLFEFVAATAINKPDHPNFLYIDGETEQLGDFSRHLYRRNFPGQAVVYYFPGAGIYLMRMLELTDSLNLNGKSVSEGLIYPFDKGSALRSFKISPAYYSEILSAFFRERIVHPVTLVADQTSYRFPGQGGGIEPFHLTEVSGNLVAIMGSSGVGKTTMLNLLSGNLVPAAGNVFVNGVSLHAEYARLKGYIGYIPQDDLLIEELTVFENLFYSSKLCFNDLTDEAITTKVNQTLTDLGLEDTRNLQVGSPVNKLISGGQRKRLNIALELIREPSILFVDEPTSGLSSSDSENVVLLLKRQALKGKLVFVNIHQPSSDIFKQFDKLMVLDKGGRVIYYGNPSEAVMYFKSAINKADADLPECLCCGNVNPEQILQIVEEKKVDQQGYTTNERKISPERWEAMFHKNRPSSSASPPAEPPLPANPFKPLHEAGQFRVFSIRNLLIKLRDKQYLVISMTEAPLLAFILAFFSKYYAGTVNNSRAYVFYENENLPAYLFMSVVVALFIGLMGSAEQIIRDVKILKRERLLQLSWAGYIHAKIVFLFTLTALQMFIYVLAGHLFLGIYDTLATHWVILFSAAAFAIMLGLNISAGLKSVVAIYILIPLLLVPQLMLSGTILKFDKLNNKVTSSKYVPIAGDLMASRWAYEALVVGQFVSNRYEKHFYNIDRLESEASYNLNYLLPELESVVDDTQTELATRADPGRIDANLALLYNEAGKFTWQAFAPSDANLFSGEKLKPLQLEQLKIYLAELRQYYLVRLNNAIRQRDLVVDSLAQVLGQTGVVRLKEQYSNESLTKLVHNATEKNKLLRTPRWFVRKYEPIYQAPLHPIGRAHFFSPQKRIGVWLISTVWFNIGVLWLMSLVLYITLRYEALRWLINKIGRLRVFNHFG